MIAYLSNPLVWIGIALFCAFGLFKVILRSKLLVPVAQREVAPILHKVLNLGFALALLVVICGFGLAFWRVYKELDRIERAKNLLASEVLSDISSLDERLAYIDQVLEPDRFKQRLDETNEKIAPAFISELSKGYSRSLNEQAAGTLRQMFNSSPLRNEAGSSVLENLRLSGISAESYQPFYDQLAEVERVTEQLLNALTSFPSTREAPSDLEEELRQHRLRLETENLKAESQYTYGLGLGLLVAITKPPHPISLPDSARATLYNLRYLEPRELPGSEADIQAILSRSLQQLQEVVVEKSAAVKTARAQADAKLAELDTIGRIQVAPSDTWQQVVGKAITLRQLGRTTDAAAAFGRYAEMFGATDPTARQYARTAQQFTLQMGELGVTGGVYLFRVDLGSQGREAGLDVGDVIVEYGGRVTQDMNGFLDAKKLSQDRRSVQVVLLRLGSHGQFGRYRRTLPTGDLGVGMMPI